MSLTESNMMPLGTKAPDFNLLDVGDGNFKSLDSLKSDKVTVVSFICNQTTSNLPELIHSSLRYAKVFSIFCILYRLEKIQDMEHRFKKNLYLQTGTQKQEERRCSTECVCRVKSVATIQSLGRFSSI